MYLTGPLNPPLKRKKIIQKCGAPRGIEHGIDESAHRRFVSSIGVDPTGMRLGFSDCLEHVLPQPRVDLLALRHRERIAHRPDTQSALLKESFLVPNGTDSF